MGKKLSQASLKISKNQKQQFSSLIKALRPKVYITDSSSFKKLVQELTGNNGSSTATSPSSPPTSEPIGGDVQGDIATSFEISAATSSEATTTSSSSEACCYSQTCLDDTVTGGGCETNRTLDHLLAYQNLESLLFDEANPLNNSCAQMEQGVSIYDYELWGLL